MGWIKVAETLLNPFGGDDEDFQIITLLTETFRYFLTYKHTTYALKKYDYLKLF
jgi:hypothetical protein